jgi:hypothetical protein
VAYKDFEKGLKNTIEASKLLDKVYEDLKKIGDLKWDTINLVKMFYEHPNKFVDIYLREERRKAGCRTYQDHKSKVRIVATGELEK